MRVRLAVAAAIAATALILVLALSSSAPRLAGTNNVNALAFNDPLGPGKLLCQQGERVPPDAKSLVLFAGVYGRPGAPLEVTLHGEDGRRAVVPIRGGYGDGDLRVPLPEGIEGDARLCIRNDGEHRVAFVGQGREFSRSQTLTLTLARKPRDSVIQVRYYRAGAESGWGIIGDVARRMGYVKPTQGVTAWLALALVALTWAGALVIVLRGRGGVVACALVGFASAASWALITPAFHVPDEPQHFAYAQHVAQAGKPPSASGAGVFSAEEAEVFAQTEFNSVIGNPSGRPPWTASADARLDAVLDRQPGQENGGGITNATNNPPLYYFAEVVPLKIAGGGNFLDRLWAARLLSALLAGLTTAFAFLFLRELLPATPWAWPVGALALALQPTLGFISGGVNNDSALFAAGAACLWLVARAFRRGPDMRTAVGLGLAFGLGLVSKATLLGLAPGLALCGTVLVLREPSERRRAALRAALAGVGAAALPIAVYVALNLSLWDRPLWAGESGVTTTGTGKAANVRELLVYLWEFYLPRLPFMNDQFPGVYPLTDIWFEGFIGRFGWLDTAFSQGVYTAAGVVWAGLLAGAGWMLWLRRDAVRARRWELATYLAIMAGLLGLIGIAGYRYKIDTAATFEQARYLLPLGALYAALVALAARAGGARWGPVVGAVLVVMALAHGLFSQLLVVGRFYA